MGTGAPDVGAERELLRWRNAVIACFTVAGLTVAAWGPRMPSIKGSLRIDAGELGLILAGTTVGALLGMVLAAFVRRQLGGRRGVGLALGLLAVALATLSSGLALSAVPLVALGFVIVGLGIGLIEVLVNVEGAEVERRARRTLMPLMHGAWSVGVALGAGVGAACEAANISVALQFAGESILLAVTVVLVPRGIPADRYGLESAAAPRHGGFQVGRWLRSFLAQLDARLALIGLVMLGVEVGEGSASSWLSLSVTDGHGGTARFAAVMFLVFATVEATARLAGGPIVDRIGRVNAVRWTAGVGAVGALMFIASDAMATQLVGIALWAVGVSLGFPLGMSAAATGANAAVRVSVVASLGYLANLAGPPIVGHVADNVGFLKALLIVVAFLLVAAASAPALREPRAD